jgi:hypothetical protein
MADDSLLREGVEAVRGGDRARGRALLSKVVLENPKSEAAWWYLGLSVDDNQHRLYCFKQVLAINPNHEGARSRLGLSPGLDKTGRGRSSSTGDARGAGRSGRQTLVLVVLGLFTLLVVIGAGGYVFLDSMGYMDGSLVDAVSSLFSGTARAATATIPPPTQGPAPSPASTSASLSNVPTWTPTASPTPRVPTTTPTVTFTPTPAEPTEQPPTPAAFPSPNSALPVDINNGTGPLTFFPDDFDAFRFQPSDSFTLQVIATLTFHLVNPEGPLPLTLELYLWNTSEAAWDVFGVRWGDNQIPLPSIYVSNDGVVIAAIRNWGMDPVETTNIGFTYSGITEDDADIFYGLNREVIRRSTEQAATATPPFSD